VCTGVYSCGITQISAREGEEVFSTYVIPTKPISKAASTMTGITSDGNQVVVKESPVGAISTTDALIEIFGFVGEHKILLAHNNKKFDSIVRTRVEQECGLEAEFQKSVIGFVDTLPLLKEVFPGRTSYKLDLFASVFPDQPFEAHDARADVTALHSVFRPNKCT
jgi:DNA polymerase III alpha subunit (gram-positive type)